MNVTVVGCGRLGLPYSLGLALDGHNVLGLDTDPDTIAALRSGIAPFHEPGLNDALSDPIADGRVSFTDSYEEAARHGEIFFLCVPTPMALDTETPDLSNLYSAAESIVRNLTTDAVIVGKSSVPAGTAANLSESLSAVTPPGISIELAWSPDFMRQSRALEEMMRPSRIVLGVGSNAVRVEPMCRQLWRQHIADGVPLVITDLVTAELAKEAANAFISMKITFANVMSEICDATGTDLRAVLSCLSLDPRINGQCLETGAGFGGGCLPKDLRTLIALAEGIGIGDKIRLLSEIHSFNVHRPQRVIELVDKLCDGIVGKTIAVWGVSYKPGVDDNRDSPPFNIARELHRRGGCIRVSDPMTIERARREAPELSYFIDPAEAAKGADLILHLTDWKEFAEQDPLRLGRIVRQRVIFDARHTLDADRWEDAGWQYRAIGRPQPRRLSHDHVA